MKRLTLLLALVLCASIGLAQEYITVNPQIATKACALCTLKVGNTVLKHASTGFAAAVAGQKVYGVGIPEGATVTFTNAADTLTISSAPTVGGVKTVALGVLDYTSYATGDAMGQMFRVYYNAGRGGCHVLTSIILTDDADMLGNTDIVLFRAFSDTLGQDSAAVAIVASEAHKVIGSVTLATALDLGTVRLLEKDNIQLVVPKEGLWGRLVSRSTQVPTAMNNIKIRFGFK